jgi:hypothetical protein
MKVGGILSGLVASAVVFVLLLGNPAHAFIAHDHGHDHAHGGQESSVWQSLHGSLRHEEKEALPISDALLLIGSVALIVVARRQASGSPMRPSSIQNALKRGILPHRKFG